MKLPSNAQHAFSQVPRAEIPRSSFNRSHGLKTTFDAGYLVPIFFDEALPGDTFNVKMTAFARLATPIFPIMDNVYLDTFFFAVPIRLIWANWEKFNGAQDNPADSTSFVVPTIVSPAGGWAVNSLQDYLGLPTVGQVGGGNTVTHSSLWLRAYNLIWNKWFRDENLQNSVVVDTDDGPDTAGDYVLLKRGKRHDYFTSCLPWPQKGTAVPLPLTGNAPVVGLWREDAWTTSAGTFRNVSNTSATTTFARGNSNGNRTREVVVRDVDAGQLSAAVYADLSAVTSSTINALRQSFQIQKLYERDARGGTRYTEIIRSHFGVTSPDARLQRPEYLGGGTSRVQVTAVPKTSSSDGTSPQGNLAAFAQAVSKNGFIQSFTEHCILIGLASVRAELTYQQGLPRMYSRSTRWDFYWPALATIGEQAVLNKEIYCDGSANDALTFGYQERFAEYRYKPSVITGKFKSTSAANIDEWHLAQQFGSLPALNDTFIKETPPMSRVLAATGYTNDVLFDSHFDMKCVRPMPLYGVPGLIDHF